MLIAAKCQHWTIIWYLFEDLLIPYPLTNLTMIITMINGPYFCIETSSKSTIKSVTTAYGFTAFLQGSACLHIVYVDAVACLHIHYVDGMVQVQVF